MKPRTFRFLPGGTTPSKVTGVRLRLTDSVITAVEDWAVVDPESLGFAAGFVSGYVLVGIFEAKR